jgi:hypothetical protein
MASVGIAVRAVLPITESNTLRHPAAEGARGRGGRARPRGRGSGLYDSRGAALPREQIVGKANVAAKPGAAGSRDAHAAADGALEREKRRCRRGETPRAVRGKLAKSTQPILTWIMTHWLFVRAYPDAHAEQAGRGEGKGGKNEKVDWGAAAASGGRIWRQAAPKGTESAETPLKRLTSSRGVAVRAIRAAGNGKACVCRRVDRETPRARGTELSDWVTGSAFRRADIGLEKRGRNEKRYVWCMVQAPPHSFRRTWQVLVVVRV